MDKFCRICSRSDEFQKFELSTISQISNVRIDDMLVYCTQQQIITGDSLPQHICAECFTALNSAFVFRKLTFHSETGFRQMINSHLTASDPMPSMPIALVPIQMELTDHILPTLAIKEEELELVDTLAGNIIPVELTDDLSIEDNLVNIPEPPGTTRKVKRRGSSAKKCATPTTYVCKECGYTTQHFSNFKRHQTTHKHFTYGKIITKRPLHMIKNLIKPYVTTKVFKQYKPRPVKPKPVKADKEPKKKVRQRNRTLYRCDDCGYQNDLPFNFRRHQRSWNHTKMTTYPESTDSTAESILKCRDCGDEFSSNALLKSHRRNGCQPLASNLDSDYVYSDEALALCKSMGTKSRQVKRELLEQVVTMKTEPIDSESLVGDADEMEDVNQLNYEDSLVTKE